MKMFFVIATLLAMPAFVLAQASASASSRVSAGEPVEVSIGVFRFSPGEKMALELVREDPCICMCDALVVRSFYVLDGHGKRIFVDPSFPYPVSAEEWIGRWNFVDSEGEPVAPGRYLGVVETSVGVFKAEIELGSPGEMDGIGRSLAQALVCGISLFVYKLVEDEDNGAEVRLQVGERLVVVLSGNPTTGYSWMPSAEPGFLKRLGGTEYIPMGDLIGGGGIFIFRYQADGTGAGDLSFLYLRSWEGEAAEAFTVKVAVR